MIARRALLATAAALPGTCRPLAARPLSRDLPWWRERHAAKLRERAVRPIDLLLLGDSITQQYEKPEYRPVWERFYGDRRALNLGFTGDATSHLLWRIENGEVDAMTPRAAVVLIGANNFGHLHWSAEDTLLGIAAILAALHRRLPATRIVLVGVLPSDRGEWVRASTDRLNAALAREPTAFVDAGPLFRHGTTVDTTQFVDPTLTHPAPALHPTPAAQARLAAAIEPALAPLLGQTPRS